MRRIHSSWWAKVASLACAVTLTGTALTLSAGTAGASAPSGTPIKIGYLQTTQAGPSVIDEEPVLAAWAKWANANGGLNGHPVQINLVSEPGNTAVAVTDMQKMISNGDQVVFDADANDGAWAQYPEQANIPVFLSTDTIAFGKSDDTFGIPQNPITQVNEQMVAMNKAGASKMALLYCTELPQCQQAVPFYKTTGAKYGVTTPYVAAISASQPNYVAQCLAAKASGADALFVADTSATVLRVTKDCEKQGWSPHLLAGAGSYQKSSAGTPGTNGLIAPVPHVPFWDTSNPAVKNMTTQLNKYNPSITKSAYYDDTAVWNWSDGLILAAAVKGANIPASTHVTGPMLRNALFKLHTTNAGGLILPITMTAGQAESNHCFYLVSIKNNKFILPNGLHSNCVPQS